VQKQRIAVVVIAGVLAGVMPGRAGAAVFVELLRASAHPGELVSAEVDAWTATHHRRSISFLSDFLRLSLRQEAHHGAH